MTTVLDKPDVYFNTYLRILQDHGIPTEHLNRDISSATLINYAGSYFYHPSSAFFLAVQNIWYRDNNWYNPTDDSLEVILRWRDSVHDKEHHKEFAERFIFGRNFREQDRAFVFGHLRRMVHEEGYWREVIWARSNGKLDDLSEQEFNCLFAKSIQQLP